MAEIEATTTLASIELLDNLCTSCHAASAYFRKDGRKSFTLDININTGDIANKTIRRKYALNWDCWMCMTIWRLAIEESYSPLNLTSFDLAESLECGWIGNRGNTPFFNFLTNVYGASHKGTNVLFKRWDTTSYSKGTNSQNLASSTTLGPPPVINVDETTSSLSSIETAKRWMSNCHEHPSCQHVAFNFLPTRLLDLSSEGSIWVVDGKRLDHGTKYTALIYC
jgi:hypothetical protein